LQGLIALFYQANQRLDPALESGMKITGPLQFPPRTLDPIVQCQKGA